MSRLLLMAILLLAVNSLYSQTSLQSSKPFVESDVKYFAQIREIYGSERMQNDPELVNQLLILLKERVHLTYIENMPEDKYPLISSVGLHNKNNPQITAVDPVTFSPETFNPLIYNWNYFSTKYETFRIDGTNYILVVDPQTIKNQ